MYKSFYELSNRAMRIYDDISDNCKLAPFLIQTHRLFFYHQGFLSITMIFFLFNYRLNMRRQIIAQKMISLVGIKHLLSKIEYFWLVLSSNDNPINFHILCIPIQSLCDMMHSHFSLM